jgi:hypothetical protein
MATASAMSPPGGTSQPWPRAGAARSGSLRMAPCWQPAEDQKDSATYSPGARWWPCPAATGIQSESGRTVQHWPRETTAGGSAPLAAGASPPLSRPVILHTVALRGDGRVLATGGRRTGACDADEWEVAVALAAGSYHTIVATASGRVLAAGDNSLGQCDVGDWRDIVAVAAVSTQILDLRADGTVDSQCREQCQRSVPRRLLVGNSSSMRRSLSSGTKYLDGPGAISRPLPVRPCSQAPAR